MPYKSISSTTLLFSSPPLLTLDFSFLRIAGGDWATNVEERTWGYGCERTVGWEIG